MAPADAIHDLGPTELRVKQSNGSFVYLRDPAVTGDSLVGWVAPPWDKGGDLTRRALPLTEVREVAMKGNDPAANIILGLLVPALAGME